MLKRLYLDTKGFLERCLACEAEGVATPGTF